MSDQTKAGLQAPRLRPRGARWGGACTLQLPLGAGGQGARRGAWPQELLCLLEGAGRPHCPRAGSHDVGSRGHWGGGQGDRGDIVPAPCGPVDGLPRISLLRVVGCFPGTGSPETRGLAAPLPLGSWARRLLDRVVTTRLSVTTPVTATVDFLSPVAVVVSLKQNHYLVKSPTQTLLFLVPASKFAQKSPNYSELQ